MSCYLSTCFSYSNHVVEFVSCSFISTGLFVLSMIYSFICSPTFSSLIPISSFLVQSRSFFLPRSCSVPPADRIHSKNLHSLISTPSLYSHHLEFIYTNRPVLFLVGSVAVLFCFRIRLLVCSVFCPNNIDTLSTSDYTLGYLRWRGP